MTLLAFIMPDLFLEQNYSLDKIFSMKPNSSGQVNTLSFQRINMAKSMMIPFVLRRKKTDVS